MPAPSAPAAAAGEPDIVEKCKKGYKAGDKTFKIHLDGYNLTDALERQGIQAAPLSKDKGFADRVMFWKKGDEGTIDRFGPHGAAYAVGIGNRITARLQSGYLYSYALVMLLGLIGAASWAIWWAK